MILSGLEEKWAEGIEQIRGYQEQADIRQLQCEGPCGVTVDLNFILLYSEVCRLYKQAAKSGQNGQK